MQGFLKIVGSGRRTARDLTTSEAEEAMRQVLDGQATLPQVAAFMAVLRIKEESSDELAAFTRVLRRCSQRLELGLPYLVDVCLPYDGRSKSPSLVPAAALVAAAAGARVALHGRPGQSTPPKYGSGVGDILACLGVAIDLPLHAAATLIEEEQIGVAYAACAQFSPRLELFHAVRSEYGMRSFFNTIEKLINPFGAPNGVAGVFHSPMLARVAGAMQAQDYRRGIVVQGPEGSIDVLCSRRTHLLEFSAPDAAPAEQTIDPAAFGWWQRADEHAVQVATAQDNADLTLRLLSPAGDGQPIEMWRRGALMTAALLIYGAGKAATFAEALAVAQDSLLSGQAFQRLSKLRVASQALWPVAVN
jgi:anthranilate phosphoribosyltransferase